MSRRSAKWRARNFREAYMRPPEPTSGVEFQIALAIQHFNRLVPKGALCIQRTPRQKDGHYHIKYLHPTKGWRSIHRSRFRGADALLPA